MDELAHEYCGKILCFRIDADDYPRVAALYGVERIPTILVFKHAEKLETIVGTLPKSVYVAAIQKLLSQVLSDDDVALPPGPEDSATPAVS
ncbi:hypothetical protein KSP40_PGU021178 [Platanthera guangdongensis]|uniref:Thioredoxin domain-containing protein n=1 Tax=Platanthera guangdongensis TaxID=2320717 RepID=A0ABR2M4J2_9ASPA